MSQHVDLIVIGAGPGGYDAAAREAAAGKNVVVIEKDLAGGTCLNRGCIPTKCLCATASTVETVKNAAKYGVTVDGFKASFAEAQQRARNVVAELRAAVEGLLSKCTIIRGEAAINADGSVTADGQTFTADKVIIATGSRPASLPVEGADLAKTSDDFLASDELPDEMVIIGAGVIGLEFAYIANAMGSKVTVVEYCKEILPPFDAEVAKRLRLQLAEKGIAFVTSAKVTAVAEAEGRKLVKYTDKKGEKEVAADEVYMAVGRRAVIPAGLAEAGIEVSPRGFIVTDENMQTTRPNFYAVGDCNGRMMLAHVATAQSMKVLGEDVCLDVVPSAVFTSPELAMVGLTTEQCKEKGLNYSTGKALYRSNGKALASGHPEGLVKVIVDVDSRKLLGCHILGEHASDLIQEATVAMANGLTADRIAETTIHGHPTLTEILPAAIAAALR